MICLCKFPESWSLEIFGYLIPLPFKVREEPKEIMDRWGVYYYESALVFCWQKVVLYQRMPWDWAHCQTEVMLNDGTFIVKHEIEGKYKEAASYTYKRKNGDIQRVIATIGVERRTWWWRSFKWLGIPRRTVTTIDVEFSKSIGERVDSWKGGCIGCGYELLKGETPLQCLRRMERERKF